VRTFFAVLAGIALGSLGTWFLFHSSGSSSAHGVTGSAALSTANPIIGSWVGVTKYGYARAIQFATDTETFRDNNSMGSGPQTYRVQYRINGNTVQVQTADSSSVDVWHMLQANKIELLGDTYEGAVPFYSRCHTDDLGICLHDALAKTTAKDH
jgi:hypothetical protein